MDRRTAPVELKHTTENSNGAAIGNNGNTVDETIRCTMTPSSKSNERSGSMPMADKSSKQAPEAEAEKSHPWLKKLWNNLALDLPTILMMFK
jgi:hypothetical protein